MALQHPHEWSSPEAYRAEAWIDDAVGRHPVVGRWLPELRRLAAGDRPVLIAGEPGSGRELAARAIHNLSGRAAHPFVVVDCGSLSEPFLDAELLGVDGDGRAQSRGKVGVVEQAGAGTVLLAEVGDLPRHGQDLLLHLLERHEVVRLNGRTPILTPARAIATTSVDLRARSSAGLFREDLLALLSAERLTLPPLRERTDDVIPLACHILAQWCGHLGSTQGFTPEAEALLRRHSWPGNLRELREVIEQAALRARTARIGVEHLPEALRAAGGTLPSLRDVEMHHIERVLLEARGNQRRASRILGISRWSLSRRLRKYGIEPH